MIGKNKRIDNIQLGLFCIGFTVLFVLFLVGLYERINDDQTMVLFKQGNDYMADFLNVLEYSKELNPYVNEANGLWEKAYFPVSYVLFFVFGKLMGFDGYDGTLASVSVQELFFSNFIMMFMMVLLMLQVFNMINKEKWIKFTISVILVLSGVSLFAYERGNIIVLAVCGMLFYLYTYDSDNKILRELGYISLAGAVALKGYPALLGILLVYRKQWKEVIRLIMYGLFFSFGPFIFIEGGLKNIPRWIQNVKLNSECYEFLQHPKVGYCYFIAYAEELTYDKKELIRNIWKPIIYALSLLGVISSWFQTRKWLKIGMLVTIILMIPSNCGYYCLLYIFPVIILFFNEEDKRWIDLLYLPLFLMLLCPFQVIEKETGRNLTLYWSNVALVMLYSGFLFENMHTMIKVGLDRKGKGIVNNGN